jgi:hypothetical protein
MARFGPPPVRVRTSPLTGFSATIGAFAHTLLSKAKETVKMVRRRIVYFLILIALCQFGYPITEQGGISLTLYQFLYSSMFVAGILLASDSRGHVLVTTTAAAIYLLAGLWYSLDPSKTWRILTAYLALLPFLVTVGYVLLRYIFLTRRVNQDVLYAAVSLYLLLGAVFVPIYGILEIVQPRSFVDSAASDQPIVWQQLLYYSYTTLTTVGYGDVLPVTWWARSLANLEMVVGVLYIAILIARLMSLYAQEP